MMDFPTTIDKARAHRYNVWAGNPKGFPYKEGHCAAEKYDGYLSYQCRRKAVAGPNNLYCKQHAKKL